MRLLIVEDNRTNLLVLKGILEKIPGCDVEACLDPLEASTRVRDNAGEPFDLMLVDYMMPGMNGTQFIAEVRQRPTYLHIPIVMITADSNRQTRLDAISAGATDFLNKPVDPVELKARVGNLLALRQAQRDLSARADWLADEVAKATRELVEQQEEVVWRLSRALTYRDDDTGEHTKRVAVVSQLIAQQLGLPADRCRTIHLAAPLHDIGKVAIPDAILFKPARLSADETSVMRTHATVGEDILGDASSDLVRTACRIAGTHHERWDGKGYPKGLAGEQIPIEGRIVSVADVFDALCTARSYKPAWPLLAARLEIEKCSGTQFDPDCVTAFAERWDEIVDLYSASVAAGTPSLSLSA
ncbi:MAG: HD domain-containing phosphohydrolase [Devosia sp.]